MEHLMNFGGSAPIRVPYLCTKMYDGGDFITYPDREGWTLSDLTNRTAHNRRPEEIAAFLQAWAYFGLLSTVFQPTDPNLDLLESFVERDEQGLKVTTKNLPELVLRWREWETTRTVQQRRERFTMIQGLFKILIKLLPLLYSYDSDPSRPTFVPWSGPPEFALSMVILADTLTWTGFQILGEPFNLDWGVSYLLISRMRAAGWCPSAIATLLKGQQIQNLYSASTLGPPMVIQDHIGRQCTETVCHFSQVVEATYVTEHCEGCQGCETIGPPLEELREIIRSGGIPAVAYHVIGTEVSVSVENVRDTLPYVAISHVWAHGLGNPLENTLPVCQLKRLQSFVDDVSQASGQPPLLPHRWWCDTLCVPVHDDDVALRKLAIKDMRIIYKNALEVLALDSSLLRLPYSTPAIELYIRLKLSSWMRRLWTFQEAILPRVIHIRLSDGSRTIQDIANSLQEEEVRSRGYIYRRYGQLSRTFFGPFVTPSQGNIITRFNATWKQLQWRSTSHEADETICLATILGLDAGVVLNIPSEDREGRMIALLRMMGNFPLLFPFQPPPRLETFGFRWAPASFLNCFRATATNPFRQLKGTATLGPGGEGLLLSNVGFIFSRENNPELAGGDDFHIAVPGQPNPSYSVGYRWDADRVARTTSTTSVEKPALVYLSMDLDTNPAILLDVLETESGSDYIRAAYIAVVFIAPVARFQDGALRRGVIYKVTESIPSQTWLIY